MLLILMVAIILRSVPELIAYPHPIGYDVVNYYIPVVTNLEQKWESIIDEFPLYVLILYALKMATDLSAYAVVAGTVIAVFGLFSLSVFYAARMLFNLGTWEGIFITFFVIVQLAVLRTAWDLHRDLLALSTMLIVFGLLSEKKKGQLTIALMVGLCCITVATDRMVGVLLVVSLGLNAIITRNRFTSRLATLSGGLFVALLVLSALSNGGTAFGNGSTNTALSEHSGFDYIILLGVLCSLVTIPAIIGFIRTRNTLLGIPFLVAGIGSLSWLVFPTPSYLVPERWIILFGVFASIFAGHFICRTFNHSRYRLVAPALVLAGFSVLGLSFVVLPYDDPFVLFAMTKDHIQDFIPATMQFNVLDVRDNDAFLLAIDGINHNTESNAVIVGEKHWRGFMDLYLKDERTYKFSQNPENLALSYAKLGNDVYLFEPKGDNSEFQITKIEDSGRR